jgi:hypothetical protein
LTLVISQRIRTSNYLIAHTFPRLFEIRNDYIEAFHQYLIKTLKMRKRPRFRNVKPWHIMYLKNLMKNKNTRDLPVDKKLLMMKEEFP